MACPSEEVSQEIGFGRQKEWGVERPCAGHTSRTDGGSVRKDLWG